MKNIWKKTATLLCGIISLIGFNFPTVQASIQYTKHIENISKTTPLYLQLNSDLNQVQNQRANDMLAGHYSHSSHMSHGSHESHYSHRSGR